MNSIVRGRLFPCTVLFPNGGGQLTKVYVVLAEGGEHAGMWCYRRPDEVAYHSLVDWTRTTVPQGRATRNGFEVHLTGGETLVCTVGSGCRCGAIGRWAGPAWSTTVAVRS